MTSDLLCEGHALFALAHQILDFLQVVLRSIVLVLFYNLHTGTAVPLTHMFDEISAIADWLTF